MTCSGVAITRDCRILPKVSWILWLVDFRRCVSCEASGTNIVLAREPFDVSQFLANPRVDSFSSFEASKGSLTMTRLGL